MYRPNYTRTENDDLAFELIQKFPLGLLISNANAGIQTGYYPFFLKSINGEKFLMGHMAKSNPQWKSMKDGAMVSFQGPNRYISPTIYGDSLNVPTWSYAVVQIHGSVELIQDDQGIFDLLNESVQFFEKENETSWNYNLPEALKKQLHAAIIGFKISIHKLDAKLKLSQNRTVGDYEVLLNFIKGSSKSGDSDFYSWMLKSKQLKI